VAEWALLVWQAGEVAMVASLQGQQEDTLAEDVVLPAMAVLLLLDPVKIALLAVSLAEVEVMELFRTSELARESTCRKQTTNTSAMEGTSTWCDTGEISPASSVSRFSCC